MNYSSILYDGFMVPLEKGVLSTIRSSLLEFAAGKVLELGSGTGINMPYYSEHQVQKLVSTDLEPDFEMIKKKTSREFMKRVVVGTADVEELPFADGSFDCVVSTLLFCSVHNPAKGLAEIRRVLAPRGKYIFLEHVLSDRPGQQRVQHVLTPLWKRMAGNCHLNRDTVKLIEESGFHLINQINRFSGIIKAGVALRD